MKKRMMMTRNTNDVMRLQANAPSDGKMVFASTAVEVEPPPSEEKGDPNRPRKFSMLAYTGGEMRVRGLSQPVVVDLAGLDLGNSARPILLDHLPLIDFTIGQTDGLEISGGSLKATGRLFPRNERARHVVEMAADGFRWQASIGARIDRIEFVSAGQKVDVNGRTFTGPINVVRRSSLGEVSFVTLGADDRTSARIAAKGDTMDFEQWVRAMALDPATLTDPQRAALLAKYKAEQDRDASDPAAGDEAEKSDASADGADDLRTYRETQAAETRRVDDVRRVCAGKHADIEARAIADGWDVTRTELEVLRASRPGVPQIGTRADGPPPDRVLAAAVALSGNLGDEAKQFGEQAVEAAGKRFRNGIGLQELFVEAARANGWTGTSFRNDSEGVLRAAFSTLSLPGILTNSANKFLLQGYTHVENVWREIGATRSNSDFKETTHHRLTGGFEYEEVGPDGELKHATVGEETYRNRVRTFGRMFAITRQDLVNDDLGALTDVPRRIGRGAALKLNDVFWGTFLNNASFFTTGNKNLISGAGSALGIDGLGLGEQAFLDQVDSDGHPIASMPKVLLVPTSLSTRAAVLMTSAEVRDTTAGKVSTTANPYVNKFRALTSAYLGNSKYAGSSSTAYYLIGDPADVPVIEVAFLNGKQTPTVETADADFNTLGVQMRGYFDFGVALLDPRGAVKVAGV